MAVSIEERKNTDGTITYRVRWRQDGTRPTYTFNTGRLGPAAGDLADRFAQLVAAAGDRLPDRAALALFGLGWILPTDEPSTVRDPGNDLIRESRIVTVADMCTRYIAFLCGSLAAPEKRTWREYESYVRLYIEPRPLGQRDVTDPALTFRDIDAWQVELASTVAPGGRRPLGTNSIAKVRAGLLAPAFGWACSPKSALDAALTPLRTAPNPVTHSTAPELVPATPREILRSPADYATFIRCAYTVDPNWADWVVMVAATGVRDGEAVMFDPAAVDLDRGVVEVRSRFTAGEIEAGGKNGHRRTVPIPAPVLERVIVPRLERAGSTSRWLFTGPRGHRWAYSTAADRWAALRDRLAAAGLRRHLTPHGLRTGYSTWLTGHDHHPTKIDMVMGHVSTSMRHRYNQLTDRDLHAIGATLAPLFAADWPAGR